MEWVILILVLILLLLVVLSCIKVVPQAKAFVVERLGAYQGPGLRDCILRSRLLSG